MYTHNAHFHEQSKVLDVFAENGVPKKSVDLSSRFPLCKEALMKILITNESFFLLHATRGLGFPNNTARLGTQSLDPYLNSTMDHFVFPDKSLSSPSSEESERQIRSVDSRVIPRKVEGVLRSASSSASQTSVIRDWSSRLLSSYSHTLAIRNTPYPQWNQRKAHFIANIVS